MIRGKRVLVTGGAGFLGANLCYRLVALGNHVIVVDNLYTGRLKNIAPLCDQGKVTFIHHDIINPLVINNIDMIFNLACPASPPHYQKDPIFTTKTSVLGALNLLELARKLHIPILQASTSEVYGDPEMHPQQETYRGSVNPIGIRACYDEGKRCAESLFFDYHRMYGVAIKVVRIFNTYGPFMDPADGRVVSNFIMQALQRKPLTMYGAGMQTRSFCYVDDLIEGLIAMMMSPLSFCGPVNLGNPHEFTLQALASQVIIATKNKVDIVYQPLPHDDPIQRKPDISLAQSMLRWTPRVELAQGLVNTVEYFKQYVSSNEECIRDQC